MYKRPDARDFHKPQDMMTVMETSITCVTATRYCYNGHDTGPNSGRDRPPERQGCMGELDDLVIMVEQVHRRLSRGHQRREGYLGWIGM